MVIQPASCHSHRPPYLVTYPHPYLVRHILLHDIDDVAFRVSDRAEKLRHYNTWSWFLESRKLFLADYCVVHTYMKKTNVDSTLSLLHRVTSPTQSAKLTAIKNLQLQLWGMGFIIMRQLWQLQICFKLYSTAVFLNQISTYTFTYQSSEHSPRCPVLWDRTYSKGWQLSNEGDECLLDMPM